MEAVTQVGYTLGYSDGIASFQLHDGTTADVYRGGLNHPLKSFPDGRSRLRAMFVIRVGLGPTDRSYASNSVA